MHVQWAFFFSRKYDTDLQLSLFFPKVVVLLRSVVRLSLLPPNAREAVNQPSQSAILRVSTCKLPLGRGVASRYCFMFILYVHFGSWRWDHHDAPKRLVPVTQWRSDTSQDREREGGERETAVLTTHEQKIFRASVVWDLICCHPEAFVWKYQWFPTSLRFGPPCEMNSSWYRDSWFVGLLYRRIAFKLQLKCDGTRWRMGGEVKGNLANGVGSQYPSHYLGTWCIQHYYRWCAHFGCQQSTELTPPPIEMDSSVVPKDEIWFLRVCHHISTGLYQRWPAGRPATI